MTQRFSKELVIIIKNAGHSSAPVDKEKGRGFVEHCKFAYSSNLDIWGKLSCPFLFNYILTL